MRTVAAAALSALVALAAFTPSRDARAETEFDVAVAGGKVTVTTKGNWHINKDYPWKLTVGSTSLDKSKWTIAETSASLANAPKGAGKLKGAVCSGDQCKTFEKDVTVQ